MTPAPQVCGVGSEPKWPPMATIRAPLDKPVLNSADETQQVDLNIARQAIDAVGAELGVASVRTDDIYQPAR